MNKKDQELLDYAERRGVKIFALAPLLVSELVHRVNPLGCDDRIRTLADLCTQGWADPNKLAPHGYDSLEEYTAELRSSNFEYAASVQLELLRKVRKGEGVMNAVFGQRRFLQELGVENLRKFVKEAGCSLASICTSEEELADLVACSEQVIVGE